ncbi:MAG: hypothetical protein RQ745_13030 [Longimicrobiales bacterium]|nr:hypothetical protein [Longimicrobiales bacterium]
MNRKTLPVRLDESLYGLLKEVSHLRDEPMVEVVRESLRRYLPEAARQESRALEEQLSKLRQLAEQHPDYIDRGLDEFRQAEIEVEDPLEDELEVVEESGASAPGEVTSRVRRAFD